MKKELSKAPIQTWENCVLSAARHFKPASGYLSDNDLLDLVQWRTLAYFWENGHPVSCMARERTPKDADPGHPNDLVATGATGFGLMALIVGAKRGWIPHNQVVSRISFIAHFLAKAETHHGVFPHWMHGTHGWTWAFDEEKNDDGGDLVETAFLVAGLKLSRQYLLQLMHQSPLSELTMTAATAAVDTIDQITNRVQWNWHVPEGSSDLLWHRAANGEWRIKLPITGWNECLIAHVLAAGSPTYAVPDHVYHQGWARGSKFGNDHINQPLFTAHSSFVWLDPRGLRDQYVDGDYADFVRKQIKHNWRSGPGTHCWGLSAVTDNTGYNMYSPTNNRGVISPSAAIASIALTPELALPTIRHFYEVWGDRIFGKYGFVDAFNPKTGWVSEEHVGINQGLIGMIEHFRSEDFRALLMSDPDIQRGLTRLGFQSPHLKQPAPLYGQVLDFFRPARLGLRLAS